MLTDTHCHLASHRFSPEELPEILANARAAGISRLVTLATSLSDIAANLALAADPWIHACVGIHPCDVHHAPDDAVMRMAEFCADPRVCAIGESGLDYYHAAPDGWETAAFRARQQDFLRQQFQLAAASGLNIVIHTRDVEGHASLDDALEIYANYHEKVRAVFHCFIGTWENAQRVLELGGLLSFGGVATFKNARQVKDTLCHCPPGTFMLETDAPYLAPEPFRGKRNEPSYVLKTAECIASLRNESLPDLLLHTHRAAESFFRFRSVSN